MWALGRKRTYMTVLGVEGSRGLGVMAGGGLEGHCMLCVWRTVQSSMDHLWLIQRLSGCSQQLQGLIYEIGGPWVASVFPKGRRMACL